MRPEIKSPAIGVRGERGAAGVSETTGVRSCAGAGEESNFDVTFSGTGEVRPEFSGSSTVRVVISAFFIDGLLTLTTYRPGGISPRNP